MKVDDLAMKVAKMKKLMVSLLPVVLQVDDLTTKLANMNGYRYEN